jgi:uncharacterized protein YjiS (DUF1127 family)
MLAMLSSATLPLLNLLLAPWHALARRVAFWRAKGRSLGVDDLRAMSDMELKDLGMGRSEIDHQAKLGRRPEER